jgi:LmbE family N-acetylglucosaminyl deacetylase
LKPPLKILAFSGHTDDVEIGAGATLSRLMEEGASLRSIAFVCPLEELHEEHAKAHSIITSLKPIPELDVIRHDFPNMKLPEYRQEILDIIWKEYHAYKPDIVLTHNPHDTHQDHHTVYEETVRACKKGTIWAYQTPKNMRLFNENLYVEVQDRHVDVKIEALKCYKSQFERNRAEFNEQFLISNMVAKGQQIGVKYAEAFQVITMAIKSERWKP